MAALLVHGLTYVSIDLAATIVRKAFPGSRSFSVDNFSDLEQIALRFVLAQGPALLSCVRFRVSGVPLSESGFSAAGVIEAVSTWN
ncbi:MAG: hypothetical protein JSS20_11665 [Proteobacteria bacterium]|nr:hypothetical protein [Pseudomonadota bacterium]